MWVLLTTVTMTLAPTLDCKPIAQAFLSGFPTAQSCLDFGQRWSALTLKHTDKNLYVVVHYDCMKQ